MGLFSSKQFIRNDKIEGQGKSVLAKAKQIKLRVKELDRLYHEFVKFEDKNTHLLEIKNLFNYYKIYYSFFDSILFQFFDLTKSGFLNFQDFVIIMWAILSTDDDGLANLCFAILDSSRSKSMHINEAKYLINIIWEFKPNRQSMDAMHKLDQNKDGFVTMPEFVLLCRHYPAVLQPVRNMKKSFQKVIVHRGFWKIITPRRLEDFGNGTVFDILEVNDARYMTVNIGYINLRTDIVPIKFIEQYNLTMKKKQSSTKGNIDMPYELQALFQSPVKQPTFIMEGLPPISTDRSNPGQEVVPFHKNRNMESSEAEEEKEEVPEEKEDEDDPNIVAETMHKVRIKGDRKQFLASSKS